MAEWEFVRQMNQNNIQISCTSQNIETLYQYQMINQNRMSGLIPCNLRIINGNTVLLYNISSMQSLASLFYEKKIERKWFCDFLIALKNVLANLEEHLLDHRSIQLSPELIFQDVDSGKPCFLYYPYSEHMWKENQQKFSDFLLEKVSHEDDFFAEIIYEIYDRISSSEDLTWINDVWKHLDEFDEEVANNIDERVISQMTEEDEISAMCERDTDEEIEELLAPNKHSNKIQNIKKVLLVSATYLLGVILSLGYVYSNYILTPKETGIMLGVVAALTLFVCIWSYRVLAEKNEERQIDDLLESYETSHSNRKMRSEYENDREIEVCTDRNSFAEREEKSECYNIEEEDENEYGKTRYFEPQELENKLYGIGKNKQILELYKFPYTIGKKREFVDGVIIDDSVSRMHARLFYKDGELYLQDLNSTNGTFKNGLPMEPNEILPLYKGDEIRFGKIPFAYR